MVYLPGTEKQLKILLENLKFSPDSILIIGSNSEQTAIKLSKISGTKIFLIVEDNESLLHSRLLLSKEKNISVRKMEFDNTDFVNSQFDLVYAQGSISTSKRNKIVKEVNRILEHHGYFCPGEIVCLNPDVPKFVHDIFLQSDLNPLLAENLSSYYSERNYKIIYEKDISDTLKDFYSATKSLIKRKFPNEADKIYYKKILNRISHESNAYLKMGGDKYIGFKTLLLQKEAE